MLDGCLSAHSVKGKISHSFPFIQSWIGLNREAATDKVFCVWIPQSLEKQVLWHSEIGQLLRSIFFSTILAMIFSLLQKNFQGNFAKQETLLPMLH